MPVDMENGDTLYPTATGWIPLQRVDTIAVSAWFPRNSGATVCIARKRLVAAVRKFRAIARKKH